MGTLVLPLDPGGQVRELRGDGTRVEEVDHLNVGQPLDRRPDPSFVDKRDVCGPGVTLSHWQTQRPEGVDVPDATDDEEPTHEVTTDPHLATMSTTTSTLSSSRRRPIDIPSTLAVWKVCNAGPMPPSARLPINPTVNSPW